MRKLTILVDLDSTIVDLSPTWYGKYNEKYGDDLSLEKVLSWDTHLYAKHGKAVYSVLSEPGFFRHLPMLKGAAETTKYWVQCGHRVVIASACSKAAFGDKACWVDQYMPWIAKENVMLGYAKDLLFADVMVDDGPYNIKDYRAQWGHYPLLCAISYPYNQDLYGIADLMAQDWKSPEIAWAQIVDEVDYFAHQDIHRGFPKKTDHGIGQEAA